MPVYQWPTYPNLCVSAGALIVAIAVGFYSWRHRRRTGANFLIWLSIATALWAVFYLLELLCKEESNKIIWENFQYLPISVIPIIYFGFIIIFTNREKIFKGKTFYWLLLEPILAQVVVWTSPPTLWFRASSFIDYRGLTSADFPGIHVNHYGWWFWVMLIYIMCFLLVDLVLLIISFFKTPSYARAKLWYLIFGIFIPWAICGITLPLLIKNAEDYYLQIALSLSLITISWGLIRNRVLEILPIARRVLLGQMSDAVIVLDSNGKVVDLNHAAKRFFGENPLVWANRHLAALIPELSHLQFGPSFLKPEELETRISLDGQLKTYDIRISPLIDETSILAGWLVLLQDITSRKVEEEKLKNAESVAQKALSELRLHAEELSTLRTISEVLNKATTLRQALVPSLKNILEISDGKHAWILLLEDDRETFEIIEYLPNEGDGTVQTIEKPQNEVDCLKDLLKGSLKEPRFYQDCTCLQSEDKEFFSSRHFVFPLISGAVELGLVDIALDETQEVSHDSVRLIESICSSLSVSIERVRLFKSEYEQRRLAETNQEISNTLTASLDINEVLDLLLDQISRLIPYDVGSVMFLDEKKAWITRSKGYETYGKKVVEEINQLSFPISTTQNINKIYKRKQPLFIADIRLDPEWKRVNIASNNHSWIGAPVIIDNRVAAIFSLEKKEPGFYNKTHAERLMNLCLPASLAIQNARLYEAGLKRIQELESLQATLKDINAELDPKQLLNDITERAVTLLESSVGLLGQYDKNTKNIRVTVGIGKGVELVGLSSELGKDILGKVAETRKPIVIQDYSTWENRNQNYVKVFPHALLMMPLTAGDELLGVIGIGDSNSNRIYNDEDIRLLTLFAQQATIALTNARLYVDAKRRAEESETMRQASAIVASTLEQKQALHLILEQLALVIPCDSASVLLPKGKDLEIVDGRGFSEMTPILGKRIPLDSSQPGALVFRNMRTMVVNHMNDEYPAFNLVSGMPIQSWIGIPIIFQNKVIGILSLDSLTANSYSEEHARLAKAFADQVAIALENVRLYEDAVKSAKRLASLYKMSQRINANLKPEEVYRAIHKATIELMAPDSFLLSMYDEDTQMINDVYFVDHGIPQKTTSRPLGEGLSSRVVKEKKSLMYNDFNLNMLKKTKAILVGDEKDETMVRSLIIVPLKIGKKVKGILSAQSYRGDAFTEDDKDTLELLAAHAIIALENAQLFSEIEELAITDSLTRIFNRRHFYEIAEQEFERSRRYSRPVSVIMMDIDHFKNFNDTYGHHFGDQVLTQIAETCRRALREVDIFARYGGEEFVILLPETTAGEAEMMAERLRQLIARTPFQISEKTTNITLSFGVVELDESCKDTEELIDRSDRALYHSKRNGRNQVTVWNPKVDANEAGNTNL